MSKKLIIINTNKNIFLKNYIENFDYYSINSGKINNKFSRSINSSKQFHLKALSIKKLYIDIINSFGNYYEDDKKKFGFNPFYLTDVSCKRTEFLSNFDYICHILLIREAIDSNNYQEILFYNIPVEFQNAIKKSFNIKTIIIKKNIYSFSNFLKITFSQFNFILKLIITKLILNILSYNKNIMFKNKNIFFSTYPKNFNNYKHLKYGNYKINNSSFLLSLISDNIHQNLRLKNIYKVIRDLRINFKDEYIISENYFTLNDIFYFLKINLYYYKFINKNFDNHYIQSINITELIKKDISSHFYKIPRLIMLNKIYQRISNKINQEINFYYYLFEYPYGRMLSLSFKNRSIIKYGFQHGPAGNLKMICFLSKQESNYLQKFSFIPENTIVEDKISYQIYTEGNYKNLVIMEQIYRLNYLKGLKKLQTLSNNHLIACGLHDGFMLINQLDNKIRQSSAITYIIKLHPKASNNKIIEFIKNQKYPNLIIANKNIEYYIENVDKIYFSYTSVGNEAEKLGINFEVIFSYFKLNESIYCTKERLKSI